MVAEKTAPRATTPFLSLRWQALIGLSLILVVVNASLAFLANEQSVRQFELQQSQIRDQQARQLRTMVNARSQEMSKLASLVPLLGPSGRAPDLTAQLREALDTNGALLGLEWDIRSVHWITPDRETALTWPQSASEIPPELLERIELSPDDTASILSCRPRCGQYLATPLLWQGTFAGTLVLGRSLADSLLAFSALTAAEIAIALTDDPKKRARLDPESPDYLRFPAVTHPQEALPVLRAAGYALLELGRDMSPILVQQGNGWFEIFRIVEFAEGVDAFVINEVSAQQESIKNAMHHGLLMGALGLLLSETLLLMIMKPPLYRLRHLAAALPLLAERRYADLRSRLGYFGTRRLSRDEIDLMIETVRRLTDRMEGLQQGRQQAEEQLVWLADHDPLTGLMNRRRFEEDFQRIVDQAARYRHQGGLLYLDLDEFKEVNDLSGHQVGDRLLQRVAERLRDITRSSDLLARLGGDEFALALPEASAQNAVACAESVQKAIRTISLQEEGREHRVSASIGIVSFPDHGLAIRQLMANADLAMYRAKDRGRGRWHLFSEEDPGREQLDERILWREQIAAALCDDRFELHAQPIVEIATGKPCHLELLLRMQDREGGLIYPDRFIPVAEETGQIQAIDHWVLSQAVKLLAERGGLALAINLSANAMDDPLILSTLERLLEEYAIRPSRLSIEITERVAIDSLSSATRLMRSIQELGCRFALDDFGSGYASYAYLRQLPVDDIKIDGAFIRDLPNNREDRILVKAITDMAHGLGKRVTAEFVETAETLAILQEIGVDCAQGYYFARPSRLPDV